MKYQWKRRSNCDKKGIRRIYEANMKRRYTQRMKNKCNYFNL